jgi:hypothetical protein
LTETFSTIENKNMRLFKNILLTVGLITATAIPAMAQGGRGFDAFENPRSITITQATNILSGGQVSTTNVIDRIGFTGIAKLTLFGATNAGAATWTNIVQSSPDTTNWYPTLYALATNTTIVYTNSAYATTNVFLFGTNNYLLPGVLTTPAIATAGFGTPYLAMIAYTNTNSIVLGSSGVEEIGFNISDQNRYIRVITQTYSNVSFGVQLTGFKTGN